MCSIDSSTVTTFWLKISAAVSSEESFLQAFKMDSHTVLSFAEASSAVCLSVAFDALM